MHYPWHRQGLYLFSWSRACEPTDKNQWSPSSSRSIMIYPGRNGRRAIQLYNSSRIPEAGDHSLPIQDRADLEKCLKVWNVPKATLQFPIYSSPSVEAQREITGIMQNMP
ncbi:hypothetical protein H9L39_08637 [Fusarium oxysporum f. sp. albedinis]|nr:hypothetical protein H9L39_08637 [Fusarium oxysporum f. sp. albedinis]